MGASEKAHKGMEDIMKADADDASLQAYKKSLGLSDTAVIIDENNPSKIIIDELMMIFPDETDHNFAVSLDPSKKETYTVKKGSTYQVALKFRCQRDMVYGMFLGVKFKKTVFSSKKK